MVPADCDICKRHLMIWDVTTFYCRMNDGIGEIDVCNDCLSKDRIQKDTTSKLKFARRETEEEIAARAAKLQEIEADAAVKIRQAVFGKDSFFDSGFTGPEDGSEERFVKRKREVPWLTHTAWWFVHNCVAHVLIGVLPLKPFFQFHDWTSRKMHAHKG